MPTSSFRRRVLPPTFVLAVLAASPFLARAEQAHAPEMQIRARRGCSTPVSERTRDAGCYTTAEQVLGPLPAAHQFWHIHEIADMRPVTDAAGGRSTIVQSLGRRWLFTIAEEGWLAPRGERRALIGPLQVTPGASYTAHYMEAVFPPDLDTGLTGHRHPGSEAWLVLSGTQCLETPNGLIMASAGQAALVPEGWPMTISSVGPRTRRALVLVLHRSDEPYSMAVDHTTHEGAPHANWKPKGLCPQ